MDNLFGGDSTLVVRPVLPGGGGSIPTSPLQKSEWLVSGCTMRQLREMIGREHYARRGSSTAVFRHGLYRKSDSWCAGVAWWIPPTKDAAAASFPEGDFRRVLALHRLACHSSAPKNSPSFLIRHSLEFIRKDGRFDCLVTYADTRQGHSGGIYKATGWEYCGEVAGDTTWLDADGATVSRKSGRGRTIAEMQARGYRAAGRHPKHKFRMIIGRSGQ